MRMLLVGYGKMGQLVGSLAAEYGGEIAGIIDPLSPAHGGDGRRKSQTCFPVFTSSARTAPHDSSSSRFSLPPV